MKYEYDGKLWKTSRTKSSRYSFFHAAFGVREEGEKHYKDKIAQIRQNNWLNFLIYYENKPRPPMLNEMLKDYFTSRGWFCENNDHFKKYIQKIEREWEVHEEDLQLLSALENVKIILFHFSEKNPEVIEPNVELLGDYPLRSRNSPETATILLEYLRYKKLNPLVQTKSITKTERSLNTYKKRTPANALTEIFCEINLLAIVLLNALKYYEDWYLLADVADAGYFDDVVFTWGPSNDAFLMQVRLSRKHISERKLLVDTYSGFSLLKFFFAYQEVKSKFNVKNVVLCTSAGISLGSIEKFTNKKTLVEGDLLYFEGTKSESYTFNDTMTRFLMEKLETCEGSTHHKLFITEENVKRFLNDFQMIVLYEADLEEAIDSRIIQLGIADKHNSIDYARHLHRNLLEWYDEGDGCLTPLEVKASFTELIRIKLINKVSSIKIEFQKSNISIDSKKVIHYVFENDYTLTLVRVVRLLEKDIPKMLFCNCEDPIYQQKLTIEAFHRPKYSTLVVIAQKYVPKLYDEIVRVLQEPNRKKVVLIANKQDELARRLADYYGNQFQTVNDEVTIQDLTKKSQDLVLEKALRVLEDSIQKHE